MEFRYIDRLALIRHAPSVITDEDLIKSKVLLPTLVTFSNPSFVKQLGVVKFGPYSIGRMIIPGHPESRREVFDDIMGGEYPKSVTSHEGFPQTNSNFTLITSTLNYFYSYIKKCVPLLTILFHSY